MDNLTIERVWQDDDFFEIKVTAQSELVIATAYSYSTDSNIEELSKRLASFPCSHTDEFLWENGMKGDGYTPYVSLRFFCRDKLGHIGIEAYLEIDDGGSYNEHHCCFYLATETGVLNAFGRSLTVLNDSVNGTKVELVWE